jgi:hypothetical protein
VPAALRPLLGAVLLATPTALAFFSGGFFDEPRLVAAVGVWILVGLAAVLAERPLPRARPALLAIAALALLTAWSALSLLWAPLSEPATDDVQRDLLYLGGLLASASLLRGGVARAVEPALAAGTLIVIGYGLAGRLLPGVVELSASTSAIGRLEQPLTYWNATGALAAVGFVLCARLAGDATRAPALRAGALAGSVPLAAGVYLSFSRGAMLAVVAGLAVLVLVARERPQLRASAAALGLGLAAAVAVGVLPGVRALEGSLGAREREGAIGLAILLGLMGAAALLGLALARREREGRAGSGSLSLPRFTRPLALGLGLVLVVGLTAAAYVENRAGREVATGATTKRLRSLQSRRYEYWEVAGRAAAAHPVAGVGAGGFRVEWLRERPLPEPADDAHSLPLETLAELGLVGLALLVGFAVAIVACARRLPPALVAGPAAALVAWALHAGLDWDWEMPALTLVAILLAGFVLAQADSEVALD